MNKDKLKEQLGRAVEGNENEAQFTRLGITLSICPLWASGDIYLNDGSKIFGFTSKDAVKVVTRLRPDRIILNEMPGPPFGHYSVRCTFHGERWKLVEKIAPAALCGDRGAWEAYRQTVHDGTAWICNL